MSILHGRTPHCVGAVWTGTWQANSPECCGSEGNEYVPWISVRYSHWEASRPMSLCTLWASFRRTPSHSWIQHGGGRRGFRVQALSVSKNTRHCWHDAHIHRSMEYIHTEGERDPENVLKGSLPTCLNVNIYSLRTFIVRVQSKMTVNTILWDRGSEYGGEGVGRL